MRWKRVGLAVLVVVLSAILGATVLREPIAVAASPFTNVIIGNTTANPVPVAQQGTADVKVTNSSLSVQQQGTADVRVTNASVPVQQQGTADVRVTNSSLSVAPQAPITGGGYGIGANAGDSVGVVDNTATAISLTMGAGVTSAQIQWRGKDVAFFYGPAFGGQPSVVLSLPQPIRIDKLVCNGSSGLCTLGWVGADS